MPCETKFINTLKMINEQFASVCLKLRVPKVLKIIPSIWVMKRKHCISTGNPYKWKAWLNLHSCKQKHGVNYWETYAPVIAWTTIFLFLVLVLLNKWCSRKVDFVIANRKADIECPMVMEIPKG